MCCPEKTDNEMDICYIKQFERKREDFILHELSVKLLNVKEMGNQANA